MTPAQTAPAAAGISKSARVAEAPASADSGNARLHQLVLDSLDDDQAQDVVSIPLEGKSSIADYMVIASGRSTRQVAAIATKLAERLKAAGFGTPRIEGLPAADWVLIDAGDVVVHLFRPEVRSFYNLERMWGFGDEQAAVGNA
jgi:ribosome-associated protein